MCRFLRRSGSRVNGLNMKPYHDTKHTNQNIKSNIQMRWLVLFIVSFLFALNISQIQAEQSLNFLDLTNWSNKGDGTWNVQTGGRTVTQTKNGGPTFFLSPDSFSNVIIKGTIEVATTNDNDFIGFVMGYENIGDDYNFVLFDWKQEVQNNAQEGFHLALIDGDFSGGFSSSVFWDHDNSDSRHTELQDPPSKNDGWLDNTEYQFEILYTSERIRIKINDETIYNVTSGAFNPGKIGFYNSSQDNVIYGNVRVVNVDSNLENPQAADDTYGLVTSNGITLNVGADEGLLFNDYDPQLDAFEIIVTSPPAIGELSVVTSSGAFVYTSAGLGEETFKYKLKELNSGLESDEATVTLLIRDAANEAPSDILFAQDYELTEFERDVVIGTLAAIDANLPLDFHDFILTDNGGGRFGINGNQITIASAGGITPGDVYGISVKAIDFDGLSIEKMLNVTAPNIITYDLAGGVNHAENISAFFPKDETFSLVSPSKIGYTFLGWYDNSVDGNQITEISLATSQNYTFYARWEVIKFPINYELNQGTLAQSNMTQYALDGSTIFFNNPTKAGFAFEGWRLTTSGQTYQTPAGLLSIIPATSGSIQAVMHNYELILGDVAWTAARDYCANQGGYLATVTSQLEWSYILQKILQDSDPDDRYWLGAEALNKDNPNANPTDQNWTWLNGEGSVPLPGSGGFEKWASGEPNNHGASGEFYLTTWGDQLWNDLPNSYPGMHGFVCESDLTVNFTGAITLTAVFTGDFFTISYQPNNDESLSDDSFRAGNDLSLPVVTRPGFDFVGWFSDSELNQAFDQTTMPAENLTLYGGWTPIDYTISFDAAGGSSVSSIVAPYLSAVQLPTPDRPGYTFMGWFLGDTNIPIDTTVPLGNQTYIAQWQINTYTVQFDTAGGLPENSIVGEYLSSIRLPAAKRPGYTLLGWYLGNQRIPYTTTVPLGDQTYTARWEANLYTLTMTNTVNDESSTITAAYDSPIVVPLYKLEGYTFRGWFEGGTNVSFNRMPLGDRTIRAIMEPNPYTITFDTQGAPAIASLTAPYMSDISLPVPEYENHTFDGWLLNGEKATLSTMPLNGATLVASWVKDEQTITFTSSVGSAPAPITAPIGEAIALPTMNVPGYTFDGWFEGETLVNLTTMPELPVTLTARFTRLSYTVEILGFNGVLIDRVTADFGATVTLPTLDVLGYYMSGWTLNGNAIRGNQISMPAGGGTLQAQFLPFIYPITFVHKDFIESIDAAYESDVTLPASNVTGYAFLGWQLGDEFVETLQVPLRGATLTAIYEPFSSRQTIVTPLQTITLIHTTDQPFNGPSLTTPDPLIFRGYYTEPFGLGDRLTADSISENGLLTRAYPYIVDPTVSIETRDARTLYQGPQPSQAMPEITEYSNDASFASEWISLALWSLGLTTLFWVVRKGGRS